jgi:hypothetical protein
MPEFRKHAGWYVTGYDVSPNLKQKLCRVKRLGELEDVLAELDPALTVDPATLHAPRGKAGKPQKVSLPEGFLANRDDPNPFGAEPLSILSGG